MEITLSEAARVLDISRAAVSKWSKKTGAKRPEFFVEYKPGKLCVETDHPEWVRRVQLKEAGMPPGGGRLNQERGKSGGDKAAVKKAERRAEALTTTDEEDASVQGEIRTPELDPEEQELYARAKKADYEKAIYNANIQKEKAQQEIIKTAELKRELAPIHLIEHFFSFAENLIQRIHRRPYEISPQLEALYVGKEPKKAVSLMIRELESIVRDCQGELLKTIEAEGYGMREAGNKKVKRKK